LEIVPFDRSHTSTSSIVIVTMTVFCTVFEIKRYISRKTPIFAPLVFNLHDPLEPLQIFEILTQTIRVPELLRCAKILSKSSRMQQRYRQTDRQTTVYCTDDRRTAR